MLNLGGWYMFLTFLTIFFVTWEDIMRTPAKLLIFGRVSWAPSQRNEAHPRLSLVLDIDFLSFPWFPKRVECDSDFSFEVFILKTSADPWDSCWLTGLSMSWSWGIEAATTRSGSFPMTGAIFWASSDSGYEYNWIRCALMGWSIDQLAQLIFHTKPIGTYFPMNGTSMVLNMSPNPMDWRRWKCRQLHRDGPRGPKENQSQRWVLIVQPDFFQCFPCLFHHKKTYLGLCRYIPKQKYEYTYIYVYI